MQFETQSHYFFSLKCLFLFAVYKGQIDFSEKILDKILKKYFEKYNEKSDFFSKKLAL